ncbi:serine/threonine protein kinase [Actinoallomurus spadix]|uniref:non-specific serine/threonine protein kinase n=1 Tax=Actinoallomurus spadix TaxID=79912 RepID=A0ABN0X9C4_9ACTN|nr:serine/threonine-protein kinase [Actinoallomurus spadix]MCO5987963.1 serine/threonine protein kinase [Actinoallomurus spadix]
MDGNRTVPGYRQIRVLGQGASGTVVLAVHEATGTPAAIKYLSEELRADAEFLDRFRAEARLMAELADPHVVRLYEYYETPATAAFVMELVDGVTLKDVLRTQGPTGPEAALVVLKGSLRGLAAAHAAGVVHRDYKPANVLVGDDGESRLADFGIAVRADEHAAASGTPAYMAPEQWTTGAVGPATDVYAATGVFYECLTGERPYPVDGLWALAAAHRLDPIPVERVPPELRGLVARGLAKAAADRPASAEAFLAELEDAALAGYGPGWEERGRVRLAALAALLAYLFPLARPITAGGTALALTRLGRSRLMVVAGMAVGAIVAGGGGAYVLADSHHRLGVGAAATSTPSVVAEPNPSPSETESPSPSPTPSDSPTPAASPPTSGTTSPPAPASPGATTPAKGPTKPVVVVPKPTPKPVKSTPTTVTGLSVDGVTVGAAANGAAPNRAAAAASGYVVTATVTVTVSGPGTVGVTVVFASGEQSVSGEASVEGAGSHQVTVTRELGQCVRVVTADASSGGRSAGGKGQCPAVGD